jgi:NADPH:quinone reductase-like Zn-dependent oxidoreductase
MAARLASPCDGAHLRSAGLPAVDDFAGKGDLDDEVACQLTAMPLSALMALEEMGVKPGQWIVQNAATGAVGKTLAMISAARGIHVINLVRRKEAADAFPRSPSAMLSR